VIGRRAFLLLSVYQPPCQAILSSILVSVEIFGNDAIEYGKSQGTVCSSSYGNMNAILCRGYPFWFDNNQLKFQASNLQSMSASGRFELAGA
jgi:hypothetical protein